MKGLLIIPASLFLMFQAREYELTIKAGDCAPEDECFPGATCLEMFSSLQEDRVDFSCFPKELAPLIMGKFHSPETATIYECEELDGKPCNSCCSSESSGGFIEKPTCVEEKYKDKACIFEADSGIKVQKIDEPPKNDNLQKVEEIAV